MPHGPLALYRAIGEDRYVSAGELPPEAGAFGQALWEVYDRHFGRFTGAGLDPGFTRFVRSDARFGSPRFPADVPVVVTGAGPSLDAAASELRSRRTRLLIVTVPAGALALQQHGLSPDLVIIEREPGGREDEPATLDLVLGPRAGCLVDPAAPIASCERTAAVRRLARDLPSWGVWPATAVAVALAGGATRIALLGLDADVLARTGDPAACQALLSVLATHGSAQCLEVGADPTCAGWWPVSWPNLAPPGAPEAPSIEWVDEGGADSLRPEALRDLQRLAPLLPDARRALELARRARAGELVPARDLTRAVEMLLAWGADPWVRFTLQQALGVTFLPRLWRTGVSMANPSRLWRPLVLALHELVEQADRFESRLTTLGHAPARGAHARGGARSSGERPRPLRSGSIDQARISLVVPVLDDHAFLPETLASLVAQTYENLELLVVHDAARAGLCAPIRELARTNLRLVEAPSSLADALNVGIEAASGAFIAHHGADDVSHPQRLARQMAYLRAHPEVGVLATASAFVDADGRAVAAPREDSGPEAWTPSALQQRLLFGPCFEHGTVLARRGVIEAAGGYRSRLASAPDQDLWLRLLPTAGFAKLPTRLYTRRLTPTVASLA